MILPCSAFLKRGESWLLQMLSASTRLDAYVRDAHEAPVLGGCLGHTLEFSEKFLFSGVLCEELSTMGTWR
jgi:hypothetical protein